MSTLSESSCEACRVDAPSLSEQELKDLLPQIPTWQLVNHDGIPKLRGVFAFKNFADALAYANGVGALAEAQGHHPEIIVAWGEVTISWWTHKIRGLHRNDVLMAAKCDVLFSSSLPTT